MTDHPPQPPSPEDEGLGGLHLREPAPQLVRYLCIAWVALSAIYLVYLAIITMLYAFSPEGEFENRMLPNPPLGRTWLLIALLFVATLIRLGASLAILRGNRGAPAVRVGWVFLVLAMLGGMIDAYMPKARLTVIGDVRATPTAVAVLAAVTLVSLLWPGTLRWVWSKGELAVPYATYYNEIMTESEIRQLKSGEASVRLPSVRDGAGEKGGAEGGAGEVKGGISDDDGGVPASPPLE